MRQRSPRTQLFGDLIGVAIMVIALPIALWSGSSTLLARLSIVALAIVFIVGLATPPIANYRRAIGKPLRIDRYLPKDLY